MNGTECCPQAPVAEGGPVGFFDGGNRRDWFPGGRGSEGGFRPLKARYQTIQGVRINSEIDIVSPIYVDLRFPLAREAKTPMTQRTPKTVKAAFTLRNKTG